MSVVGDAGTGATVGMAFGPEGALIGAGAGALVGVGQYLWNKNQQKKDDANRPQYNIPSEVGQGLDLAKQQALQGLPQAMQEQYKSNLQRSQAYSLSQNQTRKGGLSGIASLNENQNQGYANLLSQDAQAQQAKMPALYGQLNNVAENKQQAFQINQLNPYYEHIQRDAANRGAIFQNVTKGAQLGMYAGQGKGKGAGTGYGTPNPGANNGGAGYGYGGNTDLNPTYDPTTTA